MSISLRGHGGSGTVNGDTSYKNQLDDDLVDFMKAVGLDDPKVHRTLGGFSLGGGLVLRTASGAHRGAFDAYLAISPYVASDLPTTPRNAGGWASVAVSRVIGLSLLDTFGLPWFQDLPGDPRRHRRRAQRQPHAGLFLAPARRLPDAARLARRNRTHRQADGGRRRRARRALHRGGLRAAVRRAQSEGRRVGAAGPRPHGHDRRPARHAGIADAWRRLAEPRRCSAPDGST